MKRDKFLTEARGECWHDFTRSSNQRVCHCGLVLYPHEQIGINPNFSTWQGFGKLWEWSQEQEWWDEFVDKDLVSRGHKPWLFPLGWINPNRFADAVYEFLNREVDQ